VGAATTGLRAGLYLSRRAITGVLAVRGFV